MRKFPPVVFFLFLASCPLHIALPQVLHLNPGHFIGRLIDIETGKGIAFAHIHNESLRMSTIADTSGSYVIKAKAGDTLVFSALGYLGKYIVINEMDSRKALVTGLVPRTYDIAEVEVIGYASYSQFKQQFRRFKPPKTEVDLLREELHGIALGIGKEARYQLAMEQAARGGNLLSAKILSPEDIQRLKLKEIIREERVQAVIDKKFNRQIVADLTGLKDPELDDFMLFCKLDRQFLLEAHQYDILVKVLEKLEEFRQLKKNSGIIQNFVHYACYTIFSGYTESPPENQKIYSCHSCIYFLQHQSTDRWNPLLQMRKFSENGCI